MTATSTMDRARQLRAEGLTNEVIAERLQLKVHQIRYMLKPLAKPRGKSKAKTLVTREMAFEAINCGIAATAKKFSVSSHRMKEKMLECGFSIPAQGVYLRPKRRGGDRVAPTETVKASAQAQSERVRAARFIVHRAGVILSHGPDREFCEHRARALEDCSDFARAARGETDAPRAAVVESGSAEAKAVGL